MLLDYLKEAPVGFFVETPDYTLQVCTEGKVLYKDDTSVRYYDIDDLPIYDLHTYSDAPGKGVK